MTVRFTEGSDGMSDLVYPLEGEMGSSIGGCETEKVRAYDSYELFLELGLEP